MKYNYHIHDNLDFFIDEDSNEFDDTGYVSNVSDEHYLDNYDE